MEVKTCAYCGKPDALVQLFQCGACHAAKYCSRECQKKHWSVHKPQCEAIKRVPEPAGGVFGVGFAAYNEQGEPIPSSAFKIGLTPIVSNAPRALNGNEQRGHPAAGAARTPAVRIRRVMQTSWVCDLCNAACAAGTAAAFYANTPHAGDLAFCTACDAAGKTPDDVKGCPQQ